jgi:putative salt-induced outer membrane protein
MRSHPPIWLLLLVLVALPALPAQAASSGWTGSLGLSFTNTTGNTSTSNLGADLKLKLEPKPWGMEAAFSWVRAELNGKTSADQLAGTVRATREIDEALSVFAGIAGERNTFAGLDQRLGVQAGAAYKLLLGPRYELAVDGGVTRTREKRTDGTSTNDWGGLVGASFALHFSATGVLTERLVFYPNFSDSANWRATSDLAVQAKLSEMLSLRMGYQVKYSNDPPANPSRPGHDFGKTDTSTLASVVVSF